MTQAQAETARKKVRYEALPPFTPRQFYQIKKAAEEQGLVVVSRWRKGLKHIRFKEIVLREWREK